MMRNELHYVEPKHASFLNLKDGYDSACIATPPSDPIPLSDTNKEANELNIRAMISVHYNGVGPRDIGLTILFLGVSEFQGGGGSIRFILYFMKIWNRLWIQCTKNHNTRLKV